MARGNLRGKKFPLLQQAAQGSLREHHRFLLAQWIALWEELAVRIAKFEQRIEEQMRPFAQAVATWDSLPGIDRVTAWTMVAEIGADMTQFPTAGTRVILMHRLWVTGVYWRKLTFFSVMIRFLPPPRP